MAGPARAANYEEHMRLPEDNRAALYFGYMYGGIQSDRSSETAKEVMITCAINYAVKSLQADIERDLGNLVRISGKVYDVSPLIGQALYSTCLRKVQGAKR